MRRSSSIEGCGGVEPEEKSKRLSDAPKKPAATTSPCTRIATSGVRAKCIQKQQEILIEKKHIETTHSSPDLKPRERQLTYQRKLVFSAGRICLTAFRRVTLDWTRKTEL